MELISSVTVPKNWEELVNLKSVLPVCTSEVARLPEDLHFYRTYLKFVPKEMRLKVINHLIGNNDICFLKNNFPYTRLLQNLPHVRHFCLWSKNGKLTKTEVELKINQIFPGKPYFWFENSETIKSVPEIWHCQVFINDLSF